MQVSDLIQPEATLARIKGLSKKQVLKELAEKAAELTGLPERDIFDTLLQRERLGSTGIGHGVAIPHGKLASLGEVFGLLATLDRPIPFEAADEQPVDLVFLLLAPENAGADHLKALARIARLARTPGVADNLRAANTPAALRRALKEGQAQDAA